METTVVHRCVDVVVEGARVGTSVDDVKHVVVPSTMCASQSYRIPRLSVEMSAMTVSDDEVGVGSVMGQPPPVQTSEKLGVGSGMGQPPPVQTSEKLGVGSGMGQPPPVQTSEKLEL